jgi:cell division protein FtsB
MLNKVIRFLKNKYLLTLSFMVVWLFFFDHNDIFSQIELRKKLVDLETEKNYYIVEIEKNKTGLLELKTNKNNLEKFAREKYLMKRDREDIFVIVRK